MRDFDGFAKAFAAHWAAPRVDRLPEDNRATERVSYFDPLPLLAAGLRSPRGWLQLWRSPR